MNFNITEFKNNIPNSNMADKEDAISTSRDHSLEASKMFYKKRQRPTKSIGHYIIGNKFLYQFTNFL